MIVLGITGMMGSGKSYVCRLFAERGVHVYDTDSNAKRLLIENHKLIAHMRAMYDDEVYTEDGRWNREYVVSLIKQDPDVLVEMGHAVEPYLVEDFRRFKIFSKQQLRLFPGAGGIIAIESAVLTRSELLMKEIDDVIVVTAPLETRMARIRKRDPRRTDREIEVMIKSQVAVPLCKTGFFIDNDGLNEAGASVDRIINRLITA
jgi:dephospho-CoA kinase